MTEGSAEALAGIVCSPDSRGKDKSKARKTLSKRAKKGDEAAMQALMDIVNHPDSRGKDKSKARKALSKS